MVHANMLWVRNDMEDNILFEELRRICKEDNVLPYESMACHTSIKAGGKCRAYVTPDDMATFVELVVFLRQNNIEYFVAGNGSNLLVSDAGFKGVVISLGKRFSDYEMMLQSVDSYISEDRKQVRCYPHYRILLPRIL